LLQKVVNQGVRLSLNVSLYQRGLDGPGSSQDLPLWQTELTNPDEPHLMRMPKTSTIASAFKVDVSFVVEKGSAVQYVAPQYGLTEANPATWDPAKDVVPKHQGDAPGFVFIKLMGWQGAKVKVHLNKIDVMAKEGGMGSTGAFNAGLLVASTMLMGSGLSEGDIFSVGTKMENAEFAGLTGGQELLSSLQGGSMLHIWLFGFSQGYSAFTVPLTDKAAANALSSTSDLSSAALSKLTASALYVQAGKSFKNGKAEVHRTAAAVNIMWTDLLTDHDAATLPVLQRMKELSGLYATSLLESDMAVTVNVINEFVDLRIQMGHRWLELVHQAAENVKKASGATASEIIGNGSKMAQLQVMLKASGLSDAGLRYAYRVWDTTDNTYFEFDSTRSLYAELKEKNELHRLSSHDFYVYGPVVNLLELTRKKGDIAVMPLGAGGPGANLIVLTSNARGVAYLQEVLGSAGIEELNEEEVSTIVKGSGTIRGWMPFTIGPDPWDYTLEAHIPPENTSDQLRTDVATLVRKIKANRPIPAEWATYDQRSGHIHLLTKQ